eukprot:COSAG03_NODE_22283_length_293_cov_0.773196_1_plen_29_part_10
MLYACASIASGTGTSDDFDGGLFIRSGIG